MYYLNSHFFQLGIGADLINIHILHTQITNARGMENIAGQYNVDTILGVGDNFYSYGVERDTCVMRMQRTWTDVYKGPNLDKSTWYVIAGNHDHRGDVRAQMAYTHHNPRWVFPHYFYTFDKIFPAADGVYGAKSGNPNAPQHMAMGGEEGEEFEHEEWEEGENEIWLEKHKKHKKEEYEGEGEFEPINDEEDESIYQQAINYWAPQKAGPGEMRVQYIMIDTVLLTGESYHDEWSNTFVKPRGPANQGVAINHLRWIEQQLQNSDANFIWVVGHYAIYSVCNHGPDEYLNLLLKPLLERYGATGYIAGHDHCASYIIEPSKN
eukprot:UN06983